MNIFDQLKNNLNEISSLIRSNDHPAAIKLLRESRELIKDYKPSSNEKSALLFYLDRLKLKAKALYSDPDIDSLDELAKKIKEQKKNSPGPTESAAQTGRDEETGETGLVRQTEQTDQTKQAGQTARGRRAARAGAAGRADRAFFRVGLAEAGTLEANALQAVVPAEGGLDPRAR